MKTAVSIPDDLFLRAERLARGAKKNRSQVFAEALRDYVARHDPDAVTESLDRLVEELEPGEDAFLATAAHDALGRTEW